MTSLNTYLIFNGNCEEAFNYYQSVMGGFFEYVGRYADMPPPDQGGVTYPPDQKNRIMHMTLRINKTTILMGSDALDGTNQRFVAGNNFSISLRTDSKEKADLYFQGLSKEGRVNMPLSYTFWSNYFGTCVDQFGISWMVAFSENNAPS